jgi:hypothetical protein
LTVISQGWRVVNIYFSGDADYETISLQRDAGSGVAEKNAGHFSAIGCDFTGGLGAIWDTGGANNVKLIDCEFRNMTESTAYAIKTVTTAIAVPLWWTIQGCNFRNNKNHISLDSSEGLFKNCVFEGAGHGITTVIKLDTKGPLNQGSKNVVVNNFFGGDFRTDSAGYIHGAGDEWTENYYEGTKADSPTQNYYVDAENGLDTNDGKSWDAPFLTMGAAFDVVASGGVIYFHGKVTEQLTTPEEVFDVTIQGVGNRPRHIDGTPKAGSQSTAMWTTPAVAETAPLVTVIQQGWRFINILFAGPDDAACVQLYRDGGSGDDERDGSHAEFINCRFASGQDGIEQSGGCGHVGIYNCFITSMTGYAIKNTVGEGIGYPIRWELIGNRFLDNANVLKMPCQNWVVKNNSFIENGTEVFDTDDGDGESGENIIVDNYFNIAKASFDPDGNVEGNADDVWSNILTDGREEGIPTN